MRTVCHPIDATLSLTEIRRSDKPAFLQYLTEKEIYDFTLAIPHPYTEKDADEWIRMNEERLAEKEPVSTYAIRENDQLVGCAGFLPFRGPLTHVAEIGYWLGKPHWGRGIMSRVVGKLVEIGFGDFKLERITAHIFSHNDRSERVLQKNHFRLEGLLRSHYYKNGRFMDAKIYARLRNDSP